MKIFFIDKKGKKLRLKKLLEETGLGTIEYKNNYSFRCTKNDIVILSEYDEREDYTSLKKYHNLIVIINKEDIPLVWKLINEYDILDVVYDNTGEEYIAERIAKLIFNLP